MDASLAFLILVFIKKFGHFLQRYSIKPPDRRRLKDLKKLIVLYRMPIIIQQF